MTRTAQDHVYYSTRSMCPSCEALVPGRVLARDDRVLLTRTCPEHGVFDGLVCEDREWYESLPRFDVEPSPPEGERPAPSAGCPDDCGLCAAHLQRAGTAAVEISNHCNAGCPACLADNQGSFQLSVAEVVEAVEGLLCAQGTVSALTLSGGEPTVHPELFEILAALDRPEIERVVVNSNGLRIARDDAFLDRLAGFDRVQVCLHFDGPGARALRGVAPEVQEAALARLCERGIDVVPLVLAARGVNEDVLGAMVEDLLVRSPRIRSVIVSMLTHAGHGGAAFPGDPMDRLTLAGALGSIERSTAGRLRRRDFMPLPMPNPLCAAIGYFLVQDGGCTPLLRHADLDRVIQFTKNANYGRVEAGLEDLLHDTLHRVFSLPDEAEDREGVLGRLRSLLEELFPSPPRPPGEQARLAEERIKTVYLMQFMDAWSFDTRRLARCSCQHLLPEGRVVPSCAYYAYHRARDPRFTGAPQ